MKKFLATVMTGMLVALSLGSAVQANNVAPGSEQANEEDPVVWYDAADYDEASGVWSDKSGNGYDAAQPEPSDRPAYVEGELNGNPVVRFSDRCCSLQSEPFDEPLSQPNTIFVVGKLDVVPTSGSFNYLIDGLSSGRHAMYALTSGNMSLYAGSRGETNISANTDWNVQTALFDGSSSTLWVNGVPSQPAVNVGSQPMTGITVGGHFDFNLLAGDLAEILVYDGALTDEERVEVEAYLKSKYAIVGGGGVEEEGLAAWYDAADYDEAAGVWADKSGNGNDAVQDDPDDRPAYVDGEVNGNPVVRFSDRCCSLQSAPFEEPLSQPNTIFMVGKLDYVPTSGSFSYFFDGLSNGRHALYALTNGNLSLWAGARGETNLRANTEWNVHTALFQGDSSLLWVNGAPNQPAVNVGSNQMTGITIGGHFSANLLAGDIAEILVYNGALTEEARLDVEAYLQSKYAIDSDADPYQMGQGTEDRDWVDGREPDPTSSERYQVQTQNGVKVAMRDGVLLDVNLDIPEMPDGPGPCAVIADGYGRSTYRFGLASRGYAVAHAAMRGSGTSEGESGLYNHYAEDGYDLVEWAAEQPWCDGNVAMFGTSLVGISQWLAAKELPPSLKAIVPDVACGDCYEHLWYPGGMLPGPGRKAREIYGPEYTEAIKHRNFDDWWRERSTTVDDLAAIVDHGIAVLATGGWQDYITPGMIQNFDDFYSMGGNGKIIIAAGAHNGHQTAVNGPYSYTEHLVLFFDHFLRGEDNDWVDGTNTRGEALIWVNGPDQWRYEESWPIPDTRRVRMHLGGRPSGSIDSLNDGSLHNYEPYPDQDAVSYSYDPEDGPFLRTMRQASGGITRVNQQPYEEEALTWTTGALDAATEVTGKYDFEFWASADTEDTDFVLMVSDVAPDGTSRYVTSGYLNAPRNESRSEPNPLVPGEIRKYELDTQATSYVFKEGHRIRLSLAGGTTAAPGQSEPQGPGKNPNPANVTIYQDAEHPSSAVIPVIGTALLPTEGEPTPDPRQDLPPGTDSNASGTGNAYTVPNADAGIAQRNIDLLANRPKPRWTDPSGADLAAGAFNPANINSDLAFTGDYAISGNYRGFGVYDVSNPEDPTLFSQVNCVGGQGDVSVHGDLLFMSVESTSARVDCTTNSDSEVFRGVRVFDISDLSNPQYVAAVQTCRGSHTNTVVTDPDDDENVYVYVSGIAGVRSAAQLERCTNPRSGNTVESHLDADGNPIYTSRFMVEVIKVPVADPSSAAVVNEARLMRDVATGSPSGLWPGGDHGPGTQSTEASDACHDITAYPEIGLAAGACEGNGILIDISEPADPKRIDAVVDPNFAYWHSATFNNDGTKVVFTDEWGGGSAPRCRPNDPENWGADAIFDLVETDDGLKMEHRSYYKIPNVQSDREVCVAHNGNLVPIPGRDVMVQAWYEGGLSVFDFTDSANPVELAYFDRGPYGAPGFNPGGGYWSTYWYNGQIYGNEIYLGFDSFDLLADGDAITENELAAARAVTLDEHNPQTQERFEWEASFSLARAGLDQLVRADGITVGLEGKIRHALDQAELWRTLPKQRAIAHTHLDRAIHLLLWQADVVDRGRTNQGDAAGLRALAETITELRATFF